MNKRNFYIYQEDLIRYEVSQKPLTISQLVEDLNKKYGQENMKKLRTDIITNYLNVMGYLVVDQNKCKWPTHMGRLLGLEVGCSTDKKGNEYEVNLYNERAQKYILDNLYDMIVY